MPDTELGNPLKIKFSATLDGHDGDSDAVTSNTLTLVHGAMAFVVLDPGIFEKFRRFMVDWALADPPDKEMADHFLEMGRGHIASIGQALGEALLK